VRKIILEQHVQQDAQRYVTPKTRMTAMDIGLITVAGQTIHVYLKARIVLILQPQDMDRMDIKDKPSVKIPQ
jgi:hypothetical protein